MQHAGYAHLIKQDSISAIAPAISVEVRSVTRKETIGQTIQRGTKQAIEQHLKEETVFLTRYDEIYRRIDQAFDILNTDLSRLVMFCLDQNGRISNHRRKQYQYRVPEEIFDALETAYQDVIASDDSGTRKN